MIIKKESNQGVGWLQILLRDDDLARQARQWGEPSQKRPRGGGPLITRPINQLARMTHFVVKDHVFLPAQWVW